MILDKVMLFVSGMLLMWVIMTPRLKANKVRTLTNRTVTKPIIKKQKTSE